MHGVAYLTLEYAFHCITRALPYNHYARNYGRRPEFTDSFRLTHEQYLILESKFYDKH